MASYDIVSLFTNVPINETIDIILEKAYSLKHRTMAFKQAYIVRKLSLVCTCTGLAYRHKIGLINCLLDRAYRICSTEQDLKKEVVKIKQVLYKNEYPPKVVTNTIQKFFESKKNPKTKRDTSYDVPKKKVFLVLPYYKGADSVKKEITNLVQSSFPQVDLRFAFKSHSTISRNFSFKDGIDKDMKSKIVYRINCLDCEKFYIGKTKRLFKQRKIEHKLLDNSSVHKHMTEERTVLIGTICKLSTPLETIEGYYCKKCYIYTTSNLNSTFKRARNSSAY
jgi:hypothetical protein